MQIFAFAGEEFFHERHTESLRYTTCDLSFDESGIDGATYIVGGSYFEDAHGSEFHVDFNLSHVRAEAVNCVGIALAIFVEGSDRGIERCLDGDHIPVLVGRNTE